MIVGNGVRLVSNPNRSLAAPVANTTLRSNWNQRGALLNIFTMPGAAKKDGIPSGLRHPQVWLMPRTATGWVSGRSGTATLVGAGGIPTATMMLLGFLTAALAGQTASTVSASALGQAQAGVTGLGEIDADITSVLNAVAALAGSSAIDADAVATLAAVAALHGDGVAAAYLAGAVAAAAALAGVGTTAAALNAITAGVAALVGTGTLPPATLDALGIVVATPTGRGTLGVSARAQGSLAATISLAATLELSPDSIAASVKTALMGTQLDGYTIEDIIKLTSAALLGKSSGGTSPVFRSLDDTADRVAGTVDRSGNRLDSILSP